MPGSCPETPTGGLPFDYRQSDGLVRISHIDFNGGAHNGLKWNYNLYPRLILYMFYIIFRAGPVWRGPGAKFGRKTGAAGESRVTESRCKAKQSRRPFLVGTYGFEEENGLY